MDTFETESGDFFDLSRLYLDSLLKGRRKEASSILLEAVGQGTKIEDVYIYVFEASLHEIGTLWQNDQINIAQEHYCTAATQMIISQLYPYIFQGQRNGHMLLATCVKGELHEIGVRMVADLFEMEGWDTYYLGANTPTKSILETIEKLEPEIIAISVSIHHNLNSMIELVNRIKELPKNDVKIIVGGRPFISSPDLCKKVGADGCANNALEAISLANKFISK